MAKLETQINQIFLSPKETRKVSLILFEEKLSATHHLFMLAELRDIQKKTELNDLSRISEIIIERFKKQKKLPAEAMFEATLAEINDDLADFAHKGRKSWLGKFSALVALKVEKDFYLANTGYTSAWLKRKNSLNEILSPDKAQTHPLKTFTNFSSGRLIDGDNLVLTSSSLFNYVSVELFSKTLNSNNLIEACAKISDILKASARSDEGFAAFMLSLVYKTSEASVSLPEPVSQLSQPDIRPTTKSRISVKPEAVPTAEKVMLPAPTIATGIYAPLPEDLIEERRIKPRFSMPTVSSLPSLPSMPELARLPKKLNLVTEFFLNVWDKIPKPRFMRNVSGPAKFFLFSFILFALLFGMNIAAFSVKRAQQAQDDKFNDAAEALVNYLTEAESSLLYKNQSQAMKLMSSAETELHKLEQIDISKVQPFQSKFDEMNNKINRVTVLRNVSPAFEMPYAINFMARAGNGYLVANENPNSLGIFTDNALNNIFMLNRVDGDIKGVAHVDGIGNFVASKDKIYKVNENSQEFVQANYVSNGDLTALKYTGNNRLHAINRSANQVIRFAVSGNTISGTANILKTNISFANAQDLALDGNDAYVLFPDRVAKFTNGNQMEFNISPVSEPPTQLTKIRVGAQVYVMEPVSQRVLIYNKRGELLNQVQFPTLNDLRDMFVDEVNHQILLVNGNKVYTLTF